MPYETLIETDALAIQTALNLEIYRAFAANRIAMPFPQREVRILGAAEIPPRATT